MIPSWNPDKTRLGRYSGSSYSSIESGEYVVLVYVDGDFSEPQSRGMTDEDIVLGCIAHLNTPPVRKKYAKGAPKPLYGSLNLVSYQRKENEGSVFYVVAMTTDQRKNKNFWGQGYGK